MWRLSFSFFFFCQTFWGGRKGNRRRKRNKFLFTPILLLSDPNLSACVKETRGATNHLQNRSFSRHLVYGLLSGPFEKGQPKHAHPLPPFLLLNFDGFSSSPHRNSHTNANIAFVPGLSLFFFFRQCTFDVHAEISWCKKRREMAGWWVFHKMFFLRWLLRFAYDLAWISLSHTLEIAAGKACNICEKLFFVPLCFIFPSFCLVYSPLFSRLISMMSALPPPSI